MNIKVAIRVRPFNKREKDLRTTLCVKMSKNSTIIVDEDGEEIKNYSYDYCFWSHDGYKTLKNGNLVPKGDFSPYADQKLVYDAVGKEILQNAIKGYNCCLFAYG